MKVFKEKKIVIINLASHAVDFVEWDGKDLLTERKVDFTVEPDFAFNVKFVDHVEDYDGVEVYRRTPEVNSGDLRQLENIIHEARQKYPDFTILVYVSLASANALKGMNFGDKVYVGTVVTATVRTIKPPVAGAWKISVV
jgi:hypothetical protein